MTIATTTTAAMIPDTFNHRGALGGDVRSGPIPGPSPEAFWGKSAMRRASSVGCMEGSLRYRLSMSNQRASILVSTYTTAMPKLWNETIETHRREVRDAILETTVSLVTEHGLRSVTMSQIAEETGIGRATLYKYFPGVEAILHAWHDRQITAHLDYLAEVRDQAGDARERLEAVLQAYALISHESRGHHDTELAALMHRDGQVVRAEQHLRRMIRDLVAGGQKSGDVRGDVTPDELVSYCLHALTAASGLPSKAAVHRLVTVTLAGLHPPA
jgi:AcrR family transcriptional regulator